MHAFLTFSITHISLKILMGVKENHWTPVWYVNSTEVYNTYENGSSLLNIPHWDPVWSRCPIGQDQERIALGHCLRALGADPV